jgi:threonine aldolase
MSCDKVRPMIDLRSDTVTLPTAAMRQAMHDAEVGDDVMEEDPTVRRLETLVSAMLGKQAALFTPSATQSNLIAMMTHCARGDEAIVGQQAHTYLFEAGGAACLGGIQPQPIEQQDDGTLDLQRVQQLIKPDNFHFARTRLLCLENTTWGKVLPSGYVDDARQLANDHGLTMHLDGARLFNAAMACGEKPADLSAVFDSITVCLSKGLGAPVGSLLVGDEEFIQQANRWRKMLGGGMRQSGILAAAGIHALENHVERLADDHHNAGRLGEELSRIEGLTVEPVQTNMVLLSVANGRASELIDFLRSKEILVAGYSGDNLRLVTHLDFSADDVQQVIAAIGEFFG